MHASTSTAPGPRRYQGVGRDGGDSLAPPRSGKVLAEALQRLLAAFDGAEFLDHAIALGRSREHRPHGDQGLPASGDERDRGLKADRLLIAQAARPRYK
jgi:hypothetical protein